MRDTRIDILRFIGLAMIILAHVKPPELVSQLRNFDVPLMVLVSGMSFGLSYKVSEPYFSYVWKRIKRLVFPVWVFLSFYFIALVMFNPTSLELNIKTIVTSYALISGIDYVWIIRVFLLVALVSPLLFTLHQRTVSDGRYFFIIAFGFVVFEFIRYLTLPYIDGGLFKLIGLITHYLIPFSLVFAVGLRLTSLPKKTLRLLLIASTVICVGFTIMLAIQFGRFVPTQEFKYPPSIYYISYSFIIAMILWMYANVIESILFKIKLHSLVMFIANNSIWIYLWHIPLIKNMEVLFQGHTFTAYVCIFSVATSVTFVQVMSINKWIVPRVINPTVKKNIKMILTG